MCYFAAATTWERCRLEQKYDPREDSTAPPRKPFPALLCSDVTDFRTTVFSLRDRMLDTTDESFEKLCKETLAPFNHVGLFEPPIPNMYGGTAMPEHRTSDIEQSISK